jgi:glyoxylase-like metal-dependent hydrolase (beta-lactamase superfamily II)
MAATFSIISIGTLSHNRLWGESAAVRTAHATTTLVSDEDRRILVDPSLPGAILASRLNERTGMRPADVTDIFLTTLRPAHHRGLDIFEHARWWAHGAEIEDYAGKLTEVLRSADRLSEEDAQRIRADLDRVKRVEPSPEKFTAQVHLYPLPGPTLGSAGLLLSPPTRTIIIAGDAAVTGEHLMRGQIWDGCDNHDLAMESMKDLLEVADLVVPGHDNIMLTPRESWM